MTSKAPIDAVTARLRLRRLLRQARRAAGLTQAKAAEALCVSRPKLTRIENGDVRASVADVRVLLERYGAHDQLGEADRLARAARGRSWTGSYSSALTPGDVACYELESAAASVTYVDLSLVPAVLRTEEYERHLATVGLFAYRSNAELRVQSCLSRQRILLADPPCLRFFIDEVVLHRGANQPVMRRQLKHLQHIADHPQISIQVLPPHTGHAPTTHSFVLLEVDDPAQRLLFVEDGHIGGLVRDEHPAALAWRQRAVDWCSTHAVPLGQGTRLLPDSDAVPARTPQAPAERGSHEGCRHQGAQEDGREGGRDGYCG